MNSIEILPCGCRVTRDCDLAGCPTGNYEYAKVCEQHLLNPETIAFEGHAWVQKDIFNALKKELKDHTWWEKTSVELQKQRDALDSQLPEGMKHCTIQFIECPVGHGRLTAANWIDHGCFICRVNALELAMRHIESVAAAFSSPCGSENRLTEIVTALISKFPHQDIEMPTNDWPATLEECQETIVALRRVIRHIHDALCSAFTSEAQP